MIATCLGCPKLSNVQVNIAPPDVVNKMFQQAAQGKNYMNAADLAAFLENVQGEKNITEAHAISLITQTILSVIPGIHFSISVQSVRLDLQGFLSYLLNPRLNPPLMPSDTVSITSNKTFFTPLFVSVNFNISCQHYIATSMLIASF